MPSNYWIKLYHEILEDPKMGRLPDRTWRRAIEIFLLAGETNGNGTLPPPSDIAWRLRTTEAEVMEDLEALATAGIVEPNGDHWHVINFAKRQAATGNAERQQQWRDRQRKSQYYNDDETDEQQGHNDPGNENVTSRYADTDIDIDIDTESEAETEPEPPKTAEAQAPAPTPSTPKSRRKSQKKPRTPVPPAVRVFRENAHRYPAKSWYSDVAQTVGDDPGNLELWGKIVHAWVGLGWKPTNVNGMLEFYRRREIPGDGKGKNNANSLRGRPAGFIGSQTTAYDYNDPTPEEITEFQAAVDARAAQRRGQAAAAPG